MSHIKGIGVELEGGWHKTFRDIRINGDGSVRRPSNISESTGHYGEIQSPVLTPDTILPWLDAHYPDGANVTCGFHIHISLESKLDYNLLVSMRFYRFFLRKWTEFGNSYGDRMPKSFWNRLAGKAAGAGASVYSEREWYPTPQMRATRKEDGVRRCHLNYCYNLHGTMECRLLPMFEEKELGIAAVKFYMEMIEEFLEMRRDSLGKPIIDERITIGRGKDA